MKDGELSIDGQTKPGGNLDIREFEDGEWVGGCYARYDNLIEKVKECLEDEEEEVKTETESNKLFKSGTNISIEMDKIFTKPQIYKLHINTKMSDNKINYDLNYDFNINAFSKPKINYLKMSVSNTSEKNDQKE